MYTNNSKRPVFIDGRLVLPGQTVQRKTVAIDTPSTTEAEDNGFNAAALLAQSARDIDDALAALDKKQLEALRALESKADKPRASVLDSLNAALLQRAG